MIVLYTLAEMRVMDRRMTGSALTGNGGNKMPDREKVMKEAEEAIDIFAKAEEPTFWMDFVRCAFENTVALLKEQEEPKQIVRKNCKEVHDDGSIYYFAEWYCPHCNMLILRGFDNPSIKFCYKCGKPVLWKGQ